MAEHRITVQMDIIGTGDTEQAAQAAAGGAYVEMVQAFNRSYNGEAEPLDVGGVPTDAAVLFARRQISRYISEVVVGWRRRKAQEDAEASVVTEAMVME